jgi:hypothetical protein
MPFELRSYPNETLRPEGDYLQQRKRGPSTFPVFGKANVPSMPETGIEPALPVMGTRPSTCPSSYLSCEGLVGQMQGNRLSVNTFGLTR